MSSAIPVRKRTSARPDFIVAITDGGAAIDLSDAQAVRMRIQRAGTGATIAEKPMSIVGSPGDGKVSCPWPAELATAGLYRCQFFIDYATGATPRIVPDIGSLELLIEQEFPAPTA